MYILGISAYYHDSAAVLVKDGVPVCGFEEERFTRIKHDNTFPANAIQACLKKEKISINNIDFVAYYEKPLLKFERIVENFVRTYPYSLSNFITALPEWLGEKINVENNIRSITGYKGDIKYVPHHLSHASSGFYTSPYKKSAVLTVDGIGEYETTVLWLGSEKGFTKIKYLDFPDSLGLLYSTFTSFLGFKVNSDEYKMMGLSAYGKPKYKKKILKIIKVGGNGSFSLDMSFFEFHKSTTMWSRKFEKLFGSPRQYGTKIAQKHRDLAASIQSVTEDIYFMILNHLQEITGETNLCISGGVALNSLANGKIFERTKFKNIHNLGCAGDSGGAIGAALYVYYLSTQNRKSYPKAFSLALGNEYGDVEVESILRERGSKYVSYRSEKELLRFVANKLAQDKIVGWFNGSMEFGPRALGKRSILANPRMRAMKKLMNKIKRREAFRPFAGSVLEEKVFDMFKIPDTQTNFSYMNFCFKTKKEFANKISAIVHKDGTCRIQTVGKQDGIYYRLINEFCRNTGIPCLLNTSFNVNNEPIVESPLQAINDFENNPFDYLVINRFIMSKK